jgi:hypothetical protein
MYCIDRYHVWHSSSDHRVRNGKPQVVHLGIGILFGGKRKVGAEVVLRCLALCTAPIPVSYIRFAHSACRGGGRGGGKEELDAPELTAAV